MDRDAAASMLLRWNETFHEHWAEIQILREAGVSQHRIEALYPSVGYANYTAKLTEVVADSRAFIKLYQQFKSDRALLLSTASSRLLMHLNEVPGTTPRSETLTFGTANTGLLVDALHRLHPRKFNHLFTSAHEFASAILAVPMLLKYISENEVHAAYRVAADRRAINITYGKLQLETQQLLTLAEDVQQRSFEVSSTKKWPQRLTHRSLLR